jgi:hypothetical protein
MEFHIKKSLQDRFDQFGMETTAEMRLIFLTYTGAPSAYFSFACYAANTYNSQHYLHLRSSCLQLSQKNYPFLLLCRLSYHSNGNETVAQINVPSRVNHRIVSLSLSYRASVHSALKLFRRSSIGEGFMNEVKNLLVTLRLGLPLSAYNCECYLSKAGHTHSDIGRTMAVRFMSQQIVEYKV